jgi:quercetin dioxygenase-like cupin family protein
MSTHASRRAFLLTAPLAAAGFRSLSAQATAPATEPVKFITNKQMDDLADKLGDHPGNQDLYAGKSLPFTYVMTVEQKKSPKEFEWHEGRDHVVQVLDGECVYEVGGTPTGAHSSKPGEWNSPTATGTTTYTMKEGDILVIPRNTLHKRTTAKEVTFTLLSTTGKV